MYNHFSLFLIDPQLVGQFIYLTFYNNVCWPLHLLVQLSIILLALTPELCMNRRNVNVFVFFINILREKIVNKWTNGRINKRVNCWLVYSHKPQFLSVCMHNNKQNSSHRKKSVNKQVTVHAQLWPKHANYSWTYTHNLQSCDSLGKSAKKKYNLMWNETYIYNYKVKQTKILWQKNITESDYKTLLKMCVSFKSRSCLNLSKNR